MPAVHVEIWSDIACPWCWIGKRRLEEARALVDFEVRVSLRAFQLNPTAPTSIDGNPDYLGRLAAKYQRTRAQAQAMIDHMTKAGAEAGLHFDFARIVPINTFDAHRVIRLAKTCGLQLEAKERLLRAYFSEGKNLANPQVLAELGAEAGLDIDRVLAALASDAHRDDVHEDLRMAAALHITGVPFFLIDGHWAVPGAQSAETLAKVMEAAATSGASAVLDGELCGPEDCKLPS